MYTLLYKFRRNGIQGPSKITTGPKTHDCVCLLLNYLRFLSYSYRFVMVSLRMVVFTR